MFRSLKFEFSGGMSEIETIMDAIADCLKAHPQTDFNIAISLTANLQTVGRRSASQVNAKEAAV